MKIRNICDGCAGFIGKGGYCAYCGCYYPAFDFSNNQEIEVDETPVAVNDEVFDCVLIADGKRICPITEFVFVEKAPNIIATSLDDELSVFIPGCCYTPSLTAKTLCNANAYKEIKELTDKGVSDLSVQFIGKENCSFDFKGYIDNFCTDAMSVDSVSTASIVIVPGSPITSKGDID